MAIPKYPASLTKAEWDKQKGLKATATTSTGVGAALDKAASAYKRVTWAHFDPNQALKVGSSLPQLQLATVAAELEFEKYVKPLIRAVEFAGSKAEKAEQEFKTKRLPTASIAQAGKVKEAAKQFAAQLALVHAEIDAIRSLAAKPVVENVVGTPWFEELDRINFFNNGSVRTWMTSKDMLRSAGSNKPSPELAQIQRRFQTELAILKKGIAELKAMRSRRMEAKVAKTLVTRTWRQVSDAFFVMKPGVQAIHREWATTQSELAGSKPAYATWEKKYPVPVALHKRVEQILVQAEVEFNHLDETIDNLQRG